MSAISGEVLFDLLSPEAREWMASQGKRRSYEDGSFIHNRGDEQPAMGVVIQGKVRLFQLRPNGAQTFVSMVRPGSHYGDIILFMGKRRTHHAVAVGQTVVDHYCPVAFAKLLKNIDIVQALYRITAGRLGQSMAMSDDLRVLPRDVHVGKILLGQWRRRGDSDWIAMVQEDLAGLVGITTMTLSKSLARLRSAGLIETGYRKIRVCDAEALKAWIKSNGLK